MTEPNLELFIERGRIMDHGKCHARAVTVTFKEALEVRVLLPWNSTQKQTSLPLLKLSLWHKRNW